MLKNEFEIEEFLKIVSDGFTSMSMSPITVLKLVDHELKHMRVREDAFLTAVASATKYRDTPDALKHAEDAWRIVDTAFSEGRRYVAIRYAQACVLSDLQKFPCARGPLARIGREAHAELKNVTPRINLNVR